MPLPHRHVKRSFRIRSWCEDTGVEKKRNLRVRGMDIGISGCRETRRSCLESWQLPWCASRGEERFGEIAVFFFQKLWRPVPLTLCSLA